MKVAIYTRVSTDEQATKGVSIDTQRERVRQFVSSQGWTVYDEYVDDGYSAKDLNRPAMQKMIQDIEKRLFDVVVVFKLDRMVRSVRDLHNLLELFEKNKVMFKSSTEVFDTTTAMGKFFITLVGAMAEWERETIAERTYINMQQRHEQGKRNGGRAPFGYDLKDGQMVVNETEAKWVRWIFEQFHIKGKKTIAKELNNKGIRSRTGTLWNGSMVDYVVTNPAYYGGLRWNYRTKKGTRTYEEILVMGTHEPIVTKDEYEAIKSTRKNRKGMGFKGHSIYPFSGVLKCARCGHNLIGGKRKRANGHYRFYKCNGRFSYGLCDMPVIAEDTLEHEFIKSIDFTEWDIELPEQNEDQGEMEKELDRILKRMERWKELYVEGDISKKEYRERLENEKEKETALLQSLNTIGEMVTKEQIENLIHNIRIRWNDVSLEERKQIVMTLFEKIEIECIQSHKGGLNARPIIEIKDIRLKY